MNEEHETIGRKLLRLKERSGLTLDGIAKRAGYAGASSVQVYFRDDFDPEALDSVLAQKLARALEGDGDPPIRRSEIMGLVDMGGEGSLRGLYEPISRLRTVDIPIYASQVADEYPIRNGKVEYKIELTKLDFGEVIGAVLRGPGLALRKGVYGFYIAGSSMMPRYRPGELVFAETTRPPSIGDDVVVTAQGTRDGSSTLQGNEDDRLTTFVAIGTLIRLSPHFVELEQYDPDTKRFHFPIQVVSEVSRIIPWREVFGV